MSSKVGVQGMKSCIVVVVNMASQIQSRDSSCDLSSPGDLRIVAKGLSIDAYICGSKVIPGHVLLRCLVQHSSKIVKMSKDWQGPNSSSTSSDVASVYLRAS